jgi:hypothetical protein
MVFTSEPHGLILHRRSAHLLRPLRGHLLHRGGGERTRIESEIARIETASIPQHSVKFLSAINVRKKINPTAFSSF